jgi:hypothetical protein
MGKILGLHTLAELQVFTAPYERTADLPPKSSTLKRSSFLGQVRAGPRGLV